MPKTTLYKIKPDSAGVDTIAVETTLRQSNQTHLLFCGGFHSNMRGLKAEFIHKLCEQYEWSYTRFDYRGHGESDGDAQFFSPQDWLTDTLSVIDAIARPVVLIGSSMGAWLAVQALLKRSSMIRGLITIAAAPDFTRELLWPALSPADQSAINDGQTIALPTHYEETHWLIRRELFDGAKPLMLLDNTAALDVRKPVRMLHGTADKDVPWTCSQRLLEKFSHSPDATLTLIQGADHRLSDPKSLSLLRSMILQLSADRPSVI